MAESKIGRRDAARRALTVLGAVMVAPSALIGCGGEEAAGALTCSDTTGLAAGAVASRESQAYTDTAANAEEKCSGCRFYTVGQAGQCGGCQVVQGPIHPDGTCNLWAAVA